MRYTIFLVVISFACLLQTYAISTSRSENANNDECHIEGAAKYVRAVITHRKADAEAIPTTQNVHRIEGPPGFLITTAFDRNSLLLSSVAGPQAILGGPLYENKQPIYTVINSTTVQANYTITAGLLNGTLPLTTAKIEEYFTFPSSQSCLIDFIEAIFYIGQK
ncbi:uncharacterized protein FA14DRAFT_161153 [Meira miltonrushii]|uniref:Uncharacterized protein n=1 Tax=Meira miltonrushii TaxID=1280837 RepID=A0A316VAD1_9BASI|nr:uncharacterized protein FA14DRAFT_161153 [Meira miltonrushii]PWN33143.1 hypothetical protein FA14DRAFT_161153 [Meira miltonrushii]